MSAIDPSTKSNCCGLASPDELALNDQALNVLREFSNTISIEQLSTHFKYPKTPKQLEQINKLVASTQESLKNLEIQRGLKAKSRSERTKKDYNVKINSFLGLVLNSSCLSNLLLVNEQLKYVSKRVPRERQHVDFVNAVFGSIVGEAPYLLHTKGPELIGGGRTEFDTPQDCLSAMRACIEKCVNWKDNIIVHSTRDDKLKKYYGRFKLVSNSRSLYSLKIPFAGTEYWETSDSSRLRHILCGGNPPISAPGTIQKKFMSDTDPAFITLYPHYAEFLRLVKAQIKQIVRNSHSDESCPITIITCCRTDPYCNGETYCMKVSPTDSKLVTCGECNLYLCVGGCGRVFHGNTPCDVSLDEATLLEIQEVTKACPHCYSPIIKNEGCNHMTCICGCEFCWLCGSEMPRDSFNRYRTDLHYGIEGRGLNGGCTQH